MSIRSKPQNEVRYDVKQQKEQRTKLQALAMSPDTSKLVEVILDERTRIYISPDKDIDEVLARYHSKHNTYLTRDE
jgi:hypothetical protein